MLFMCRVEGAGIAKALVILPETAAASIAHRHLNAQMLPDKFNCRPNGQIRISFAAARTAMFADGRQGGRGHPVGQTPGLFGQGR